MPENLTKPKLCKFGNADWLNIENIRERHGLPSNVDAIRFALRFAAQYSEPAGIAKKNLKKSQKTT